MMKKILYIDKIPKLKNPYLVVAWPGMGQVAFNVVNHIIRALPCREFAHIASQEIFYPTHVSINNSILTPQQLPNNKFYYWKNKQGNNDLLLFLSNSQPDLMRCKEYSGTILKLAKELEVQLIFSFASLPLPIDHVQKPNVWIVSSNEKLLIEQKKFNFKVLNEGKISGMNGIILGLAKQANIDGLCLLAEIPIYTIQIDNPKASLALVEAFSQITNIPLDTKLLQKQASEVESQINKLIDYFKTSIQPNPIAEEEINGLRESLNIDTRIPNSVAEKIEKLFFQAKKDIAKAYELKQELDKWNIYHDYEDRFLDLFIKLKKESN